MEERGGVISWELFTLSQMIFFGGGEEEEEEGGL